jgi:hypothetical protein
VQNFLVPAETSGTWRRVVWQTCTNFSEEPTARQSTHWPMAEETAGFSGTSTYVYLPRCHTIRWLSSSTLKPGAADTPETSVHIPRNTWSYNSTRRRTSEAHPTSDYLLLNLGYGSTHMTCRKWPLYKFEVLYLASFITLLWVILKPAVYRFRRSVTSQLQPLH